MAIFYVDFENVNASGIEGVSNLSSSDNVYILYSKNANTLRIDRVAELLKSAAKIEFVEVPVGTPNALDFQLLAMLFCKLDNNTTYIISKDQGYDAAIKMARSMGVKNIRRCQSIGAARPNPPSLEERLAVFLKNVGAGDPVVVAEALRTTSTKTAFYNFFRKKYGAKEGAVIYRALSDHYETLLEI